MSASLSNIDQLPDDALVRLSQLAYSARRRASPVLLNVSDQTIYRAIKAGTFPPPVKMGRMSLWRMGAIRAWIAALSREGQS